jgi:uncharacterized protein
MMAMHFSVIPSPRGGTPPRERGGDPVAGRGCRANAVSEAGEGHLGCPLPARAPRSPPSPAARERGNGKRIFSAFAIALLIALAAPALAQPKPPAKTGAPIQFVPETELPPPAANGAQLDLAYGAYQRGYFLTALQYATDDALKGNPQSMTLLGELYANGLGVPRDDQKAADWYKLAAARGDRNAMFALAIFALQGRAGPRDRAQSAKWLAAAAKLGHPEAAYDLALLYVEGQLFPQDFKRAAELLRQAANEGSPQAQYALGTFYKDGRGVPADMHEAVKLWAAASLAGDTDAEVEYAIALYNGDGVTRDEDAAAQIFFKAAKDGSPIAQDRYARILASGLGAPRDPVKAVKWHLVSRAGGETDITLDDFMSKLDAATVEEGTKQAQPWIAAIKQKQAAEMAAAKPEPSAAPALGMTSGVAPGK